MALVYMVTSPSGRRYVGITTQTLNIRRSGHTRAARRGSALPFHKAVRKYADALTWEIVASGLPHDEAKAEEQRLIAEYSTLASQNGYNVTKGGDGTLGLVRHDLATRNATTKRRLSDAAVTNIRILVRLGADQRDIGAWFGVTSHTVCRNNTGSLKSQTKRRASRERMLSALETFAGVRATAHATAYRIEPMAFFRALLAAGWTRTSSRARPKWERPA